MTSNNSNNNTRHNFQLLSIYSDPTQSVSDAGISLIPTPATLSQNSILVLQMSINQTANALTRDHGQISINYDMNPAD